MAKKKGKKQADEAAIAPQPSVTRNYQIPGCETHICSRTEGMDVDQFVAIAFNLAASNPGAKVSFQVTVKDPNSDD